MQKLSNDETLRLVPLKRYDREQFILDNQAAFKYGAMVEFGLRDEHFEDDGEIISRSTIEQCIDDMYSETYRIVIGTRNVGGLILHINPETHHNELEILFISPNEHNKGIGQAAWWEVEALHPETVVWSTCTPYFEIRNIHFYVNCLGFHIVEFFNSKHPDPNYPSENSDDVHDGMFRFEKVMRY